MSICPNISNHPHCNAQATITKFSVLKRCARRRNGGHLPCQLSVLTTEIYSHLLCYRSFFRPIKKPRTGKPIRGFSFRKAIANRPSVMYRRTYRMCSPPISALCNGSGRIRSHSPVDKRQLLPGRGRISAVRFLRCVFIRRRTLSAAPLKSSKRDGCAARLS